MATSLPAIFFHAAASSTPWTLWRSVDGAGRKSRIWGMRLPLQWRSPRSVQICIRAQATPSQQPSCPDSFDLSWTWASGRPPPPPGLSTWQGGEWPGCIKGCAPSSSATPTVAVWAAHPACPSPWCDLGPFSPGAQVLTVAFTAWRTPICPRQFWHRSVSESYLSAALVWCALPFLKKKSFKWHV